MKGDDCKPDKIMAEIKQVLQTAKNSNQLYPKNLKIISRTMIDTPLGNSNGGWGDVRDHNLCISHKNF